MAARLSTIIGHACSYQPSALKLFTSPRKDAIYQRTTGNPSSFTRVFREAELNKNCSQRHQKKTKNYPEILQRQFMRTNVFCNTFDAKTWNQGPQASKFRLRDRLLKGQASVPKKLQKNRFRNHSKINENQNPVQDLLETILLFPLTSKVFPRCQNCPQGCQNGGTEPPEWQLRGTERGRQQWA